MPGGGERVFNSDLACRRCVTRLVTRVSKMINVLPIVGCAAESLNKRV